jgi:hypothetical protein
MADAYRIHLGLRHQKEYQIVQLFLKSFRLYFGWYDYEYVFVVLLLKKVYRFNPLLE